MSNPRNWRRGIDIAATLLLGLVAVVVIIAVTNNVTGAPESPMSHQIRLAAQVQSISKAPTIGRSDAAVTMIEYLDFQCPFCRSFSQATLPQLLSAYVSNGSLRLAFKFLPQESSAMAMSAARAAHCSRTSDVFLEMADEFFKNRQPSTLTELDRTFDILGLRTAQFQECRESESTGATIRADITAAAALGISGTPTFLIGPTTSPETFTVTSVVIGAQRLQVFAAAIDLALSK